MIFEGYNIETFELNGQNLYNPKDIATILGIADVKSVTRNYTCEQITKVKNADIRQISFRKLNNAGEKFLTESGVLTLINKCRGYSSEKKEKLIRFLFPSKEIIVINDIKEIKFLDKLEEVLFVFDIHGIRQYRIGKYRIDLYLPELNIAIEYDENEHKSYTYKEQELREKYIKNILSCDFIRVNDYSSDEKNIGLIIKQIYVMKILKKETV